MSDISDKLRKYLIAAGAIFLFCCVLSAVQHGDVISAAIAGCIQNVISGFVSAVLPLVVTVWILKMFLGIGRK